jgi:putative transposase
MVGMPRKTAASHSNCFDGNPACSGGGPVPGVSHHVTQRGNRRQPVFFAADDYRRYIDLVGAACRRAGAEIWAYCLMPSHVHLVVASGDAEGLRATFAEAHRRYTGAINGRSRWTGHLFQGRFQVGSNVP